MSCPPASCFFLNRRGDMSYVNGGASCEIFRPTENLFDGFQRSEGDCMNPNFTHTSTTLSRQPTKMSAGRLPSVYPPTLFLLVHPWRSCGHHVWGCDIHFPTRILSLRTLFFYRFETKGLKIIESSPPLNLRPYPLLHSEKQHVSFHFRRKKFYYYRGSFLF